MNLTHFRKVVGFENYLVSRRGKVWSVRSKMFLKHWSNIKGYQRVQLYGDGVRCWNFVHRLVAIAFLDNPNKKSQVNHKNFNIGFNWTKNLEWMTQAENLKYNRNRSRYGPDGKRIKKMTHEEAKAFHGTPF